MDFRMVIICSNQATQRLNTYLHPLLDRNAKSNQNFSRLYRIEWKNWSTFIALKIYISIPT